MLFLGLLETVHETLIGFFDVTASTVLLRVISFRTYHRTKLKQSTSLTFSDIKCVALMTD